MNEGENLRDNAQPCMPLLRRGEMEKKDQVEIMEKQLSNFETLLEKMQYMNFAFDSDPEYSKEARDIVRSNICKELKEE